MPFNWCRTVNSPLFGMSNEPSILSLDTFNMAILPVTDGSFPIHVIFPDLLTVCFCRTTVNAALSKKFNDKVVSCSVVSFFSRLAVSTVTMRLLMID